MSAKTIVDPQILGPDKGWRVDQGPRKITEIPCLFNMPGNSVFDSIYLRDDWPG